MNWLKTDRRFRISVTDEAFLTEVAGARVSRAGFWMLGASFMLICIAISGLLIAFTPLRTLLPGYMKESQRSATEEGLLRLDSLINVYEENRRFISNYMSVTDVERVPTDSAAVVPEDKELNSDSLLPASNLEQRFVNRMEEHERFNISVLAPLAADGVPFSPVAANGIFTAASKGKEQAVVLLPADESLLCDADGTVISVHRTASAAGYVIMLQHNRGFITCYEGTGAPLVGIGDRLTAGEALAIGPSPNANGIRSVRLRMWHNGSPLVPYDYIGPKSTPDTARSAAFDAPRGRL